MVTALNILRPLMRLSVVRILMPPVAVLTLEGRVMSTNMITNTNISNQWEGFVKNVHCNMKGSAFI